MNRNLFLWLAGLHRNLYFFSLFSCKILLKIQSKNISCSCFEKSFICGLPRISAFNLVLSIFLLSLFRLKNKKRAQYENTRTSPVIATYCFLYFSLCATSLYLLSLRYAICYTSLNYSTVNSLPRNTGKCQAFKTILQTNVCKFWNKTSKHAPMTVKRAIPKRVSGDALFRSAFRFSLFPFVGLE